MDDKNQSSGLVEVRIYSLATTANDAIVFLEEVKGTRLLPIWIGPVEGQAIAIKFSGIPLPRPFTHDLLLSIIKNTGYTVDRVSIDAIKESTFYAAVHIKNEAGEKEIDSRPSDAIALAVRAGAPIFVAESVMAESQVMSKPITQNDVNIFKDQLKDLKPKDIFGNLGRGEGFGRQQPPPPPDDKSGGTKPQDQ